MEVKIKDRKKNISMLKIALNMSGISVDYVTTDLINDTLGLLKSKGGKASIEDSAALIVAHKKKWDDYFESQQNKETK